jgi:PAS domain S-box-containing protein
MSSRARSDPWRASQDALENLRQRLSEVANPEADEIARRLMAEVAIDKATGLLVLLSASGVVLDVNPAALSAGGIDRTEAVGRQLWNTPWWRGSPRAQADTQSAVQAAANGRLARFDVDVWIEAAGTGRGTLDLSVRPLRGRDGRIELLVADGREITDRKRAERRITRQHAEVTVLNDRLALVNEYRERLVGNLSHDLRMPLRLLVARAERILQLSEEDSVHTEAHAMRLAAIRALSQVDTLLEQARRGDAEPQLALSDGDLAIVVREVEAQFEPLARERGVQLTLHAPPSLAACFDAERVSRVFANLLANALRFTPEGGIVRCTLTVHGSLAHLEVADSGPGIEADQRAELFARFAHGDHLESGTGLGLAIVHEFVLLHGGTVSVDTAPEGGALFIVTLPLDQPASGGGTTLAQHVAAARQTELVKTSLEAELRHADADPRGTLPSVLLVDASGMLGDTLRLALGPGIVLSTAEDAVEGLQLALHLQPDLVLVGSPNGGVPGSVLVRRLVEHEAATGTIVIGVAEPETPAWQDLESAGAHRILAAGELRESVLGLLEAMRR